MKVLVDKLLVVIPAYTRQFIDLLSRPKRFVEVLNFESATALKDAVTFLAVTFGLAFVVQLPLLAEKQDKQVMFGVMAVLSAIGFLMNAAILMLAWRMVGGKLPWKRFIITSCYFASIATLILVVATLVATGVFRLIDPVDAGRFASGVAVDPVEMTGLTGPLVFLIIIGVGFLLAYVWVFAVWGAYRNLNKLSRARSGIAFVVFFVLTLVSSAIQMAMAFGVYPAAMPTAAALPPELVGVWQTESQGTSNPPRNEEVRRLRYTFMSNGTYAIADSRVQRRTLSDTRCVIIISSLDVGQARVQGTKLTLYGGIRSKTIEDGCTGKKSDSKQDQRFPAEEYQFTIQQHAEGQQLCLAGRYGESCLKAGAP